MQFDMWSVNEENVNVEQVNLVDDVPDIRVGIVTLLRNLYCPLHIGHRLGLYLGQAGSERSLRTRHIFSMGGAARQTYGSGITAPFIHSRCHNQDLSTFSVH